MARPVRVGPWATGKAEHGTFSWTGLATPDAQASKDFYGALFETTERHPPWAS
jgi:predicted enzyme related to lactoylglutathione lyase